MLNIPRYKLAFLFCDIVLLIFFLIVKSKVLIENHFDSHEFNTLILFFESMVSLALIVFLFRHYNLDKINIILDQSSHTSYLLKAISIFAIMFLFAQLFFHSNNSIQASEVILEITVLFATYFVGRVVCMVRLYRTLSQKFLSRSVLLIGERNSSNEMALRLLTENTLGIKLAGFIELSNDPPVKRINKLENLGSVSDLTSIVHKYKIDEIIITSNKIGYEELIELMSRCEKLNLSVKISSSLFQILSEKMILEKYYNFPILEISPLDYRRNYEKWKRIFDLMMANLLIIALSPILLITCFLIKIFSKGPIIYNSVRIGKNGSQFNLYKFRTMYVSEKEDEERRKVMLEFMQGSNKVAKNKKVINEQRVTKIGSFLRKFSIDELPQLFNVIKGDMSLVGPRPSLPYEYLEYKHWQKKRADVLPGCTGIWQVLGRNSVSFIDSIVMDIYYTYKMSLFTDVECILKTIPCILLAKGK